MELAERRRQLGVALDGSGGQWQQTERRAADSWHETPWTLRRCCCLAYP